MNLFETYHDYFQSFAVAHPDLLHSASNKSFELISVDEAFGVFRTGTNPESIFRLIEYSYGFTDDDQPLRIVNGGFQVLCRHSYREEGKDGFVTAMKRAQKITDHAVHKVIFDSNDGHILFDYSLNRANEFQVTQLINGGDSGWSGFNVGFTIRPTWEVCLTDDPALTW